MRILVVNVWKKSEIAEIKELWSKVQPSQIDWCDLSRFSIIIKDGHISISYSNNDLKNYDYVWIQYSWKSHDIAYSIAVYLDYYGIAHSYVEPCFSKLVDSVRFELSSNHVPDTFFCFTEDLINNVETAEFTCGYPMIIKDTKGECGIDVYLAQNRTEFKEIVAKLPPRKKFLCQRFIPNTFDYRILIGHNQVLLGEKRIRENDAFRNNVSLGAREEFMDLSAIPDGVKERAIAASKTLGLPWAGVDIVTDSVSGKNYTLEVNRRPGISKGTPEAKVVAKFLAELTKQKTPIVPQYLEDSSPLQIQVES